MLMLLLPLLFCVLISMLSPFCGPSLCLEVKYYHQDTTWKHFRALLFCQLEKKVTTTKTRHAKISDFHPRQTSTQWRKNGREALAPLGIKPRGCLWSLWHVQVCSVMAFCFQWESKNMTDQQSDAAFFSAFLWNMSSLAKGEDQMLDQFFIYEVWGWADVWVTSTAWETWSNQQDAINVTSNVGTRGSSTVHSNSSREENKCFKSDTEKN